MDWDEESDIIIITELMDYAIIIENSGNVTPQRFSALLKEAATRLLEYSDMLGTS